MRWRKPRRPSFRFIVLDRPNPVTGLHVEGPMLDANLQSFAGCYDLPVRHGLTLGELATMANAERKWNADLHVVKMQNWERGDWFDSTGLPWVDPSPNMRSLNAATLYPGLALIESSKNYSVGRGTDAPFEQIGAEWVRGVELAEFLNSRYIPGVRVYPTHLNATTEGVRFVITEPRSIRLDPPGFGGRLCPAQALSRQDRLRAIEAAHRQPQGDRRPESGR